MKHFCFSPVLSNDSKNGTLKRNAATSTTPPPPVIENQVTEKQPLSLLSTESQVSDTESSASTNNSNPFVVTCVTENTNPFQGINNPFLPNNPFVNKDDEKEEEKIELEETIKVCL